MDAVTIVDRGTVVSDALGGGPPVRAHPAIASISEHASTVSLNTFDTDDQPLVRIGQQTLVAVAQSMATPLIERDQPSPTAV